MRVDHASLTPLAATFEKILATRAIHCVFQPIVSLNDQQVLGYEALARGPAGTSLSTPDALFGYAATVGKLPDLDWICRAAAYRGALDAGLPTRIPLFINVEPSTSRTMPPADLAGVFEAAHDRLQIVAEVTERLVSSDPAGLLGVIGELREYSYRIALDDVGAQTSSQALMSLLRPDVIKLDRNIIQGPITPEACTVINAALAEAERTGAVILAEGIETTRHLAIARSLGASLGQGWLFGHPEPLPQVYAPTSTALPRVAVPPAIADTPFDIAKQVRTVTQATKDVLIPLSQHLEGKGITASEPTVLLATFQHARYFDDRTRRRYSHLAEHGIFTAAYGTEMPLDPGPNIRGCPLPQADPLAGDWTVIVIGSHFAGGLFARAKDDLGARAMDDLSARGKDDPGGEMEREFDVVISYDRDLVIAAARPLLYRLIPIRHEPMPPQLAP